jgi:hypothetical protein
MTGFWFGIITWRGVSSLDSAHHVFTASGAVRSLIHSDFDSPPCVIQIISRSSTLGHCDLARHLDEIWHSRTAGQYDAHTDESGRYVRVDLLLSAAIP